jgi:hypothetical protein
MEELMAEALSTEDRLDIQDLYARYAWALDTGNIDELVNVFLPDGTIDTGKGAEIRGHDAIRAWGMARFSAPKAAGRQHIACQFLMEGNGETCKVKAYRATLTYNQVDETKRTVTMVGYYLDTCVKKDGIWYFAKRAFRRWEGAEFPWKSPLPPLVSAART